VGTRGMGDGREVGVISMPMVPMAEAGDGKRSVHELGIYMQPVEMGSDTVWSRKEEEERRRAQEPLELADWSRRDMRAESGVENRPLADARVDARVAAGYDGAYRGN